MDQATTAALCMNSQRTGVPEESQRHFVILPLLPKPAIVRSITENCMFVAFKNAKNGVRSPLRFMEDLLPDRSILYRNRLKALVANMKEKFNEGDKTEFPTNFINSLMGWEWNILQAAVASFSPFFAVRDLPHETKKWLSRVYHFLRPAMEVWVIAFPRSQSKNMAYLSQFYRIFEDDEMFGECFANDEPIPGTKMTRRHVLRPFIHSFLSRCKGKRVAIEKRIGEEDRLYVGSESYITEMGEWFATYKDEDLAPEEGPDLDIEPIQKPAAGIALYNT